MNRFLAHLLVLLSVFALFSTLAPTYAQGSVTLIDVPTGNVINTGDTVQWQTNENTSTGRYVQLQNASTNVVTIMAVTGFGTIAPGFGIDIADLLPLTVDVNSNQLITLFCFGAAPDTLTAAVSIETSAGDFSFNVECEVLGGDPDIRLSDTHTETRDTEIPSGGSVSLGTTGIDVPFERKVRVENVGTSILSLTLNPLPPSLTSYRVSSGLGLTCTPGDLSSDNLLPGECFDLVLICEGDSVGTFGGVVSIGSNDPDENPFTFNATCEVVVGAPDIAIYDGTTLIPGDNSVTAYCPDITQGVLQQKLLTIRNEGDVPLYLAAWLPTGEGVLSVTPYADMIPAGESRILSLGCAFYFPPSVYTGNVSIESSDPDEGTYTFPVQTRILGANFQFRDESNNPITTLTLNAPGPFQSVSRTISLFNAGTEPGSVSAITPNAESDVTLTAEGRTGNYAPGDGQSVVVTCSGTSPDTQYFANRVNVQAIDSTTASRNVSLDVTCNVGTTPAPGAEITVLDFEGNTVGLGATLEMGAVNQPPNQIERFLTIQNTGDRTLNFGNSTIVDDVSGVESEISHFPVTTADSLAPSGSRLMRVLCYSATPRTFNATLTIPSNDASEPVFTLTIRCTIPVATGTPTATPTPTATASSTYTPTPTHTPTPTPTHAGSPPNAVDDTYSFAPNVPFTINPLENDSDAEGPIGLVSAGPSGNFTISGNSLVFASGLAAGTYILTYTINDTNSNTDTATITLNIVPPGSPPNAVDDTYTFAPNVPFTITPLENDNDADGPVGLVSAGPSGNFSISGNSLVFASGLAAGTYTLIYTINDTDGNTDTATVTLNIVAPPTNTPTSTPTPTPIIGSPPNAVDDTYTFAPNVPFTINPLQNDSDADGSIGLVSAGPSGNFSIVGNSLVFASGLAVGTYTLTYTINDTNGNTDTATITLNIVAPPTHTPTSTPTHTPTYTATPTRVPNRPPVVVDDGAITAAGMQVTVNVLTNDTDPDGDPLTLTNVTAYFGTLVSWNANGDVTASSSGTPGDVIPFDYVVTDGQGNTATGVLVVLSTLNPVAVDDSITVEPGTQVTVNVLGNDYDPNDYNEGGPLTVTSVSTSSGVSVNWTANGDVTLYSSSVRGDVILIDYTIADVYGATASATLTVQTRPNGRPIANADEVITATSTLVAINVLTNDTDPDGDPLTLTSVTSYGTPVNWAANGDITLYSSSVPGDILVIDYTITDGQGNTAYGTLLILSQSGNAPVAVNDTVTVPAGAAFTVNVLSNDSDPDGDPLIVTNVTTNTAVFTWDYNGNISGYASYAGDTRLFVYYIADGQGNIASATLSVIAAPDSPASATAVPTLLAVAPPPTPFPPPEVGAYLPTGPVYMSVPEAMRGLVSYRQLIGGDLAPWDRAAGAGRIGIGWLADIALNAIDVMWSGRTPANPPVMVCLRGTGRILFLAASGTPRVAVEVTPFTPDDAPNYSCIMLTEPGTVVLIPPA